MVDRRPSSAVVSLLGTFSLRDCFRNWLCLLLSLSQSVPATSLIHSLTHSFIHSFPHSPLYPPDKPLSSGRAADQTQQVPRVASLRKGLSPGGSEGAPSLPRSGMQPPAPPLVSLAGEKLEPLQKPHQVRRASGRSVGGWVGAQGCWSRAGRLASGGPGGSSMDGVWCWPGRSGHWLLSPALASLSPPHREK